MSSTYRLANNLKQTRVNFFLGHDSELVVTETSHQPSPIKNLHSTFDIRHLPMQQTLQLFNLCVLALLLIIGMGI